MPRQVSPSPDASRQGTSLTRHWRWAYRKARQFGCSKPAAAWRATRFALFGDSGRFLSHRGWTCLRRSDED